MDAEKYIIEKYGLDVTGKMPLAISKSRWEELPILFNELGLKIGVEIGVLKGEFTKVLCEAGFKMTGVDKWESYPTYRDFRKQAHLDDFYAQAKANTKGYDCKLIKAWSMDAVKKFEDESLDFVFIDGNHALEYVIEDIAKWSKKVRKGGIIAGHDYFRAKHSGNLMHVKDAVNTWAYVYGVTPWFVFTNDKCPTWFWVKK